MAYVCVLLRIHVTIFSNGSIILTSFKFTELHTLTLGTQFLWALDASYAAQ